MWSITHCARVCLGFYNVNKEKYNVSFCFLWFAYCTPAVLPAPSPPSSCIKLFNISKGKASNYLVIYFGGVPPFSRSGVTFSNTLSVAVLYCKTVPTPLVQNV